MSDLHKTAAATGSIAPVTATAGNVQLAAQGGEAAQPEAPATLVDAVDEFDLEFGDADHPEELDPAAGFASAVANQP